MANIGVFYGTMTGNTERIAETIAEQLGGTLHSVADAETADFEKYDLVVLGSATWGDGDLTEDWEDNLDNFKSASLSGKKIAMFMLGDQFGYPDSFVSSASILLEALKSTGATLIGQTSTDGYEFNESGAGVVVDGKFSGLVLDEDNQSDLTDERIEKWVSDLKASL